jgi:hypothetical protein
VWLSLVGVPRFIKEGLAPYRDLFCREAGFEPVSRYVAGLLLSPNKTLQGIYAQQVWPEAQGVSRRAMHTGVFEAGWASEGVMPRHRAVVADAQRVDGVAVEVQFPNYQAEELGYLNVTAQEDSPDLESARQRFIDLLHYRKNRLSYRKRTERSAW